MTRKASVQSTHLALESIQDGVVELTGGLYRAVLEVGSINFALKDESEQEAIVAGYAAFLNGLNFPVQLLVRAVPIDVRQYLNDLERRVSRDLPPGLSELAINHVAFVRNLAANRSLFDRRFFLVVPAENAEGRAGSLPLRRPRKAGLSRESAQRQLNFRAAEVEAALGRCGLTARRLDSSELARVFYSCWCPDLSRIQRLGRRLSEYTGPVVTSTHEKGVPNVLDKD